MKGVERASMILTVSKEVWVMRLIMETMLSLVSSNHLLGFAEDSGWFVGFGVRERAESD